MEILPPGFETDPFEEDLNLPVLPREEQRGSGREERRARDDTPRSGPPKLDEWQDFFSRVLLKGLTDRYVNLVFRDVDEELLTDREIQKIYLSREERERIARPFSELANKSKFTRKHGRSIIAFSDSIDSVLTLGIWFSRVNKIAQKHNPNRTVRGKVIHTNGHNGSVPTNGSGGNTEPEPGQSRGWDPRDYGPYFPESPGTG